MSEAARKLLTVDEFLAEYEGREGFWELWDGVPVAMAPERIVHSRIKGEAYAVLRAAIAAARAPCEALPDGATVRVRPSRAFKPDALVVCPPSPPDAIEIDNPVVVVEVLSPSTAANDHGEKLEGYFALPSVQHYLILDPDRRVVIHHRRETDFIATRVLHEGTLRLEPPGLELRVEDLFGPATSR